VLELVAAPGKETEYSTCGTRNAAVWLISSRADVFTVSKVFAYPSREHPRLQTVGEETNGTGFDRTIGWCSRVWRHRRCGDRRSGSGTGHYSEIVRTTSQRACR
jgi:hypothetical protein